MTALLLTLLTHPAQPSPTYIPLYLETSCLKETLGLN